MAIINNISDNKITVNYTINNNINNNNNKIQFIQFLISLFNKEKENYLNEFEKNKKKLDTKLKIAEFVNENTQKKNNMKNIVYLISNLINIYLQ